MKKVILFMAAVLLSSFAFVTSAAAATDVNLNNSSCVKVVVNIGSDTYHNICSGEKTTVLWGTGDWLAAISLTLLGGTALVLILGLMIGFLVSFLSDWWRDRQWKRHNSQK